VNPHEESLDSESVRVERLVERQLGRRPRGLIGLAAFCPHGYPSVIETAPYLDDGTPFPTLLYLTCPSAVARVSGLEEAGGVEALRALVTGDSALRRSLDRLTALYRARRRELYAGANDAEKGYAAAVRQGLRDGLRVLEAGIGGPTGPERASCLHAYAAAVLAALGEWQGRGSEAGGGEAGGLGSADEEQWSLFLASLGELWCADARCREYEQVNDRRAAIDVGTNSVRLMVADVRSTGTRRWPDPLVRRAEVTRLGEGLQSAHPWLGEAAMTRTRAVVDRYVEEARHLGAERITLFGTSAARRAENGAAFVQELGRYFRITAGVLSGELEAALAYSGATVDVPGEVVLLDVGGGSTELVRWDPGGESLLAQSLDLGCVSMTEAMIEGDSPTSEERARIRAHALGLLSGCASVFGGGETLVGVAGTVTTLACLSLGLSAYDPDAVHLTMLSREQIARQLERLATMSTAERSALPCVQRGRADVIVAGAEIVLAAMDALGYGLILVSERDILDGVILAAE